MVNNSESEHVMPTSKSRERILSNLDEIEKDEGPVLPEELAKYKHTLESLLRRDKAEQQIFKEKGGKISNQEIDDHLMKMLESRQGYLYKRLKAILDKRDPAQAEIIRN